jgi:hypothetical protein
MPGMRTIRQMIVVLASMPGFFVWTAAFANDEAEHHEYPHHHVALFAGGGFERDKNDHEENGTAVALIYEMQFSDRWGVGLAVEALSGDGTKRSSVLAVPVSYHPNEKWRLFAGPGMEFGDEHDKFLARIGVSYEIPFHDRWSASPEFVVDFVEGGATTYILGVAIGFGF